MYPALCYRAPAQNPSRYQYTIDYVQVRTELSEEIKRFFEEEDDDGNRVRSFTFSTVESIEKVLMSELSVHLGLYIGDQVIQALMSRFWQNGVHSNVANIATYSEWANIYEPCILSRDYGDYCLDALGERISDYIVNMMRDINLRNTLDITVLEGIERYSDAIVLTVSERWL